MNVQGADSAGFGTAGLGSAAKGVAMDQLRASAERSAGAGRAEEAASQFEALVGTMLVQEMRKTVPGGFFGEGAGSDVFGEWFDRHLGDAISSDGALGIAGVLKVQLGRAQAAVDAAAARERGGQEGDL